MARPEGPWVINNPSPLLTLRDVSDALWRLGYTKGNIRGYDTRYMHDGIPRHSRIVVLPIYSRELQLDMARAFRDGGEYVRYVRRDGQTRGGARLCIATLPPPSPAVWEAINAACRRRMCAALTNASTTTKPTSETYGGGGPPVGPNWRLGLILSGLVTGLMGS